MVIVISAVIMYNIEGEIQPDAFPNITETMWWAFATLTTIGYGDVYPVTGAGKLLASIISLLGIGLIALPTGLLASTFTQKLNEKKNKK